MSLDNLFKNFGNAGIIFFTKNEFIDNLTKYFSETPYSYIGIYFKNSDGTGYECYYTNICSINTNKMIKTNIEKLVSDTNMIKFRIKPIKITENNIYEIKFRVASAKFLMDKKFRESDSLYQSFKCFENKLKTPINYFMKLYEFLHDSNINSKTQENVNEMIGKYEIVDDNEKNYEIVNFFQTGKDDFFSSVKNSIKISLNTLMEDKTYFQEFLELNLKNEYNITNLYKTNQKKFLENYVKKFVDILDQDSNFRNNLFENDILKPDLFNIYDFNEDIKNLLEHWNIVFFLFKNCKETFIFNINQYNKSLKNNLKLSEDLNLINNSNVFINISDISELSEKLKMPNICVKCEKYIENEEYLELLQFLKKITEEFSKILLEKVLINEIHVSCINYYFHNASKVLKIFNPYFTSMPNFEQSIHVNFQKFNTNNEKEEIIQKGVNIDKFSQKFNIIKNLWNNICILLRPLNNICMIDLKLFNILIYKFCENCYQENKISFEEGYINLGYGHDEFNFNPKIETDFDVNFRRVSEIKVNMYIKYIGELFVDLIIFMKKYINHDSLLPYSQFKKKIDIIDVHVSNALNKTNIGESNELEILPKNNKHICVVKFYNNENYKLEENEFINIYQKFKTITENNDEDKIDILPMDSLITSLNKICKGLQINLDPLQFKNVQDKSCLVTFDDKPEINQKIFLKNGKPVIISLTNPNFDGLNVYELEEILETINCMSKNNLQFDNIQSIIVQKLSRM